MVFGFNSNVRVGSQTFHVQTEDRGPIRPLIETLVFAQGRVAHRRATSYEELLEPETYSDEKLRQRLEQQHRRVIDELRAGTLALEAAAPAAGLAVQLLNPASWLAGGNVALEIEVKSRPEGEPAAEATVEVLLEGAQGPHRYAAQADGRGRAQFNFPLPRLGPGGAELVIRASSPAGADEIRYALKPKAGPSAP